METMLFNQLERSRARTLQIVETVTEEAADVIPAGFNNSVRWNYGHILIVLERYVSKITGEPMEIPDHYSRLFENGTKPADWKQTPPSLSELTEQLRAQNARLWPKVAGKLDTKLPEPIRGMETFGDIMVNMVFHEGMHIGYIASLKKAVAAQP